MKVRTLVSAGFLAGALSVLLVPGAQAKSYTWIGATSGAWETSSNWSPTGVPGVGDSAYVAGSKTISRTVDGQANTIVTCGSSQTLSLTDATHFCILVGEVALDGDYTAWGTIVVDSGAKLRAGGTFYAIDLVPGSTFRPLSTAMLTVTGGGLWLDDVTVDFVATPTASAVGEGCAFVCTPYGSGGTPLLLRFAGTSPGSAWHVDWHGLADGRMKLWLINDGYQVSTACWKGDAWGAGVLVDGTAWTESKPGSGVAAKMEKGQAHVSEGENFAFGRHFLVGTSADETGEIDVSGGSIVGDSTGAALVAGSSGGSGRLLLYGGSVVLSDYLWHSALTVERGELSVGAGSVGRANVRTENGGGLTIGEGGTATLEISANERAVGSVDVSGPFAVGYTGVVSVCGGRLVGRDSFYVGRTTFTDEVYDVSMVVSDGVVSNLTDDAGSFCVGSYGGKGSRATLTLAGGELVASRQFVCGGHRSASVSVAGGRLVSPRITVGSALSDADDVACFTLSGGRVETDGFDAGATGVRSVVLNGGELVARTANDDFFGGLESVRLGGDVVISNALDIATDAILLGSGGLTKTGTGTCTIRGCSVWAGKTTVSSGVLDLDGSMLAGELVVADGASVANVRYDVLDALEPYLSGRAWTSGTTTTRAYVRLTFGLASSATAPALVTDAASATKGGFTFREREDGSVVFSGYTAAGWMDLFLADGTSVIKGTSYDVMMTFDFSSGKTGGKNYVVYSIRRGTTYERLVSSDGLSIFPVGGTLASVRTVTGLSEYAGTELDVDADKLYTWCGTQAEGAWNEASNWKHGATHACPVAGSVALVDRDSGLRVLTLPSNAQVGSFIVNGAVTLRGGSLTVGRSMTGGGAVTLEGAEVLSTGTSVDVAVPIDVPAGKAGTLGGSTSLVMSGRLYGSGTLTANAQFFGDTSAFSGTVKLTGGAIASSEAAQNVSSSWQVVRFPFAVSDQTYVFGALNGTIAAQDDDARGVRLVVGSRDEDCSLKGNWVEERGDSGLTWVAPSATLDCAVAFASYLEIRGGGRVCVSSPDGVPQDRITFADQGGVLTQASHLKPDFSGLFRDSTVAIVFDDAGGSNTWESAIGASNAGGFVKRGAGTLVLTQTPQYAGSTIVEEGTLVVPRGTQLSRVEIAPGAALVVDMTGVSFSSSEVLFAVGTASQPLQSPSFRFANQPAGYDISYVTGANNGLVATHGTQTYEWTGKSNVYWTNAANWLVSGLLPKRAPSAVDAVVFPYRSEGFSSVLIDAPVSALSVTSDGRLVVSGEGSLSVLLALSTGGGTLELDGLTLSVGDTLQTHALVGSGRVTVGCGQMTVAPTSPESYSFAGALNVTNVVKSGSGTFCFAPAEAYAGTLAVDAGTLQLDCTDAMTNQLSAHVTMKAGATLDLSGTDRIVTVAGFVGAGTIRNGALLTQSGRLYQSGGDLTVPAAGRMTYVASRADEKLVITDASGVSVTIVIPRAWFIAGASGHRAVQCAGTPAWEIERPYAELPVRESDDWWSISGGGFTIRLR